MAPAASRALARREWLAAMAVGLLAGCAAPALRPQAVLSGRLALRITEPDQAAPSGFSGSFELRGNARQGQLELSGPLGAGAVRAQWADGRYRWNDGQRERETANLAELTREVLGEALPLEALFDWLRARPWPAAASRARPDGGPGFEQLGWRVDTEAAAEGRLVFQRDGPRAVTLRVRLDNPPPP